ncbi:dihydrofolate reductase family protein [Paenibacillus mucilaginosus]|nr:dihydrofolate reductase family protein [Paenibacillus mucilaginosus]MCG7212342.1 dihydrofolate reductase family protein [Paenibacillus mucilaginosus]
MLNRISIDGYFASLNENTFGMDWFVQDPEVDIAVRSGGGTLDTLILGGHTYRGFERNWVPILHDPRAPKEWKAVAEELTAMTKIVFSSEQKEITWANTRRFNGSVVEVSQRLKEEEGSDILIMGSGTIVRQLAAEGLIDEYVFILTPVVAGQGKPLFEHVYEFGLTLTETKAFASGNVLLRYQLKQG